MTFDKMIDFIIVRIERGYANDPRDNGGETKWGISVKAYPELKGKIKDLTIEEAKKLYRRDYFTPAQVSKYPMKVRLAVLDTAINHGVLGCNRLVQQALNKLGSKLEVDGIVGPKTLAAIKKADSLDLLVGLAKARQESYRKQSDYSWAGNGWENRLFLICAAS